MHQVNLLNRKVYKAGVMLAMAPLLAAANLSIVFAQVTVTDVGRVKNPYSLVYQPGRHRIVGDTVAGAPQATTPDRDLWQIDLNNIPPDVSSQTAPSSNVFDFGDLARTRTGWRRVAPTGVQRNLPNGFIQDEIFALRREGTGTATTYHIRRYSPDGTSSSNFVNLPTTNLATNADNLALHVDHTGAWNYDLLIAFQPDDSIQSVHLYRADGFGNLTFVGAEPVRTGAPPLSQVRGMTVLPNDPAKYGSYAGHLLMLREEPSVTSGSYGAIPGSLMYTVDPVSGTFTTHSPLGLRAAVATVITGRFVYVSDWGASTVRLFEIPDLEDYLGDILLGVTDSGYAGAATHSPGLYRLYWDGSSWQTQMLVDFAALGYGFKDFSVTVVPEPASLLALSGGLAFVALRKRRKA
ncbi:MAG: PEP-CTERM sorting domain-containing protein [Fimbriimonadales bacterium]|nr:MAG: hypothetical protein KatS3mg018_0363 [Fimbriimonadales bacterium]